MILGILIVLLGLSLLIVAFILAYQGEEVAIAFGLVAAIMLVAGISISIIPNEEDPLIVNTNNDTYHIYQDSILSESGNIHITDFREYSIQTLTGEEANSIFRVELLENQIITYVKLDSIQRKVYRLLDTVWVDLSKHIICDTSQFAMKAVLKK